jgi:hypothetical protein
MLNSYNNDKLKFPLSIDEIKMVDNAWNFMDIFRETFLTRGKYDRYLEKKIKMMYSIKEFYKLEKIVEKIYWNLVSKIKSEVSLKPEIFLKERGEYNLEDVENKILMRNVKIKESTIKKTYIIKKNGKLLYKYYYPDDLDLFVSSIMINRSVYETIMSESEEIFNIEIEPYSHIVEFDYPYPNLNTIKSFVDIKEKRMEKIKEKYYSK